MSCMKSSFIHPAPGPFAEYSFRHLPKTIRDRSLQTEDRHLVLSKHWRAAEDSLDVRGAKGVECARR